MVAPQGLDDVLAVPDAAGEDEDGLSVAGVLDDLGAGAADEVARIHQVLDLTGDELAAPDMEARGVGLCDSGLGSQGREVSADDEFLDAHLVAHVVEEVVGPADHPARHAERRRREADDAHVRVHDLRIREERLVHPLPIGRNHVRFVDDDEVKRLQLGGALVDRLDAGDDDRMRGVAPAEAGRVEAHVQVRRHAVQRPGRLLQEFLHVREDQHPPLPARHSVVGHPGHHGGLAAVVMDHEMPVEVVRIAVQSEPVVLASSERLDAEARAQDRLLLRSAPGLPAPQSARHVSEVSPERYPEEPAPCACLAGGVLLGAGGGEAEAAREEQEVCGELARLCDVVATALVGVAVAVHQAGQQRQAVCTWRGQVGVGDELVPRVSSGQLKGDQRLGHHVVLAAPANQPVCRTTSPRIRHGDAAIGAPAVVDPCVRNSLVGRGQFDDVSSEVPVAQQKTQDVRRNRQARPRCELHGNAVELAKMPPGLRPREILSDRHIFGFAAALLAWETILAFVRTDQRKDMVTIDDERFPAMGDDVVEVVLAATQCCHLARLAI